MTATRKPPDPHEEPPVGHGKWAILAPLIIGGAVVIAGIVLWETYARQRDRAYICQCEEDVRRELRAAYAAMRAFDPDDALRKIDEATRLLRTFKTTWPSDYAELRIATLSMEGEALLMRDASANAQAAEARFDEALGLMSHSSGELWLLALMGIAQARVEQEKYDEAIADLDRIVTRNPNFGAAYYWRSHARRKAGDDEGALEDEARARSLDSWPPLRGFMQAANMYTRDVLHKPAGAPAAPGL